MKKGKTIALWICVNDQISSCSNPKEALLQGRYSGTLLSAIS